MTQRDITFSCPTSKITCPPCSYPEQEVKIVQEETVPPIDIVREYDYKKTFDPLEEPVRRVPRHEIHPLHMKRHIDLPTRGYPDNFTQVGVLVKKGDPNENKNNKIIRLFGRQEYPGSYKYEYYTMINSGHDQIKIPVHTRRKELYDGDTVKIKELNDKYEVQLHKFDAPKYYPDIVF